MSDVNHPGIDCGQTCSAAYPPNGTTPQTVILEAIGNAGYTFTGWSGDCTGTALSSNPITMNSDKNCTANFTIGTPPQTCTPGNICPNGNICPQSGTCPTQPPSCTPGILCLNGSICPANGTCPAQPPSCSPGNLCPNGALCTTNGVCPIQPPICTQPGTATCPNGVLCPQSGICPVDFGVTASGSSCQVIRTASDEYRTISISGFAFGPIGTSVSLSYAKDHENNVLHPTCGGWTPTTNTFDHNYAACVRTANDGLTTTFSIPTFRDPTPGGEAPSYGYAALFPPGFVDFKALADFPGGCH